MVDEDEVGFVGGSNISSLEDLVGNNSIAQDKRQKRDIGI